MGVESVSDTKNVIRFKKYWISSCSSMIASSFPKWNPDNDTTGKDASMKARQTILYSHTGCSSDIWPTLYVYGGHSSTMQILGITGRLVL